MEHGINVQSDSCQRHPIGAIALLYRRSSPNTPPKDLGRESRAIITRLKEEAAEEAAIQATQHRILTKVLSVPQPAHNGHNGNGHAVNGNVVAMASAVLEQVSVPV